MKALKEVLTSKITQLLSNVITGTQGSLASESIALNPCIQKKKKLFRGELESYEKPFGNH